jgi:hypothetical protein
MEGGREKGGSQIEGREIEWVKLRQQKQYHVFGY